MHRTSIALRLRTDDFLSFAAMQRNDGLIERGGDELGLVRTRRVMRIRLTPSNRVSAPREVAGNVSRGRALKQREASAPQAVLRHLGTFRFDRSRRNRIPITVVVRDRRSRRSELAGC
jgi:hypothetical protein